MLKPKVKTYLIAGAIGVVSLTAAAAFIQYRKFMQQHLIKFKGVMLNKLSLTNLDFNIYVNVTNNSDIALTILSQSYNIYVNNMFITKAENSSPVSVLGNATNTIGLNVTLNPSDVYKKLGQSQLGLLTDTSKTIIKVDAKLKVKMWFFTINLPYVFEKSLKDIVSSKNN